MMVVHGLMVKFKITSKWIRRFVYRLHTGLTTFSIMIILLGIFCQTGKEDAPVAAQLPDTFLLLVL